MFDLLRVARAARTVLGLVGFYRYGWFRSVAVVLACAGVGFSLAGSVAGGVIGTGVLAGVVYWVRRVWRHRY